MPEDVSDWLPGARQALGMTQDELAAALGPARNTIARWERGERLVEHGAMLRLALEALARRRRVTLELP
ncbi:MAG: helix-turn-helix transcriptional regulator [Dehalococcoidia bacterium]